MKQHAELIWGLIVAAIAALGTIKTLMIIATGDEFSLQKAGFYVGTTAIFIYVGVCVAIAAGGALVLAANLLFGEDRAERTAYNPILFIAGAVGLLTAGGMVFGNTLVYEELDAFGKGASAFIGLAAIAGTIYMWRQKKKEPETKQQG